MKAIVVEQIGRFTIKETTITSLNKDETLIKVSVAGLCRTDLKIIRQGHRDLILPRIPGEEVVGKVIATGSSDYAYLLNKRVYIYPGTSCGHCDACLKEAENLCRHMQIMGFHREGGFAEYVKAPVQSLIEIPDNISEEDAVFAEPLSCCINALELAELKAGEEIGIWGAGPAGVLLKRLSAALDAVAYVIEPDKNRRDFADAFATPPVDKRFDVAIIAVGSHEAYLEALRYLKPRGRLIVFSGLSKGYAIQPIDLNQLHYHEQTIRGAYGCSLRHSMRAIEMISKGELKVNDLISHRMSLWELENALNMVSERTCMKIHLYPS